MQEVCGHSGCTPVAVYVRPKRAGVVGGEGVGALPNMRGFDDAVGRMGGGFRATVSVGLCAICSG